MSCAEKVVDQWSKWLGESFTVCLCPYKRDMYDSVESLYIECNKRNIDVDICWLPWREKKSNIWHQEGECNMKDYYDVIVISNPYDGDNLVTEIDREYWSNKLCNRCKILCLCPYAVIGEGNVGNVLFGGYLSSNMIVVEDVKHKVQIAEQLRNWWKGVSGRDENFADKIFVFGSCKYDKVENDKRENYVLPIEWENTINNKKVVLLNTSLYSFINKQTTINKIFKIFSQYKDNEEYVLWWRPHPLLRATIETMFDKKVLDNYDELVNWYIRNNIGIYDCTSELHRAIAYSDEMISDSSSLIHLYKKTGKPLFLTNEIC